MSLELIVGPMFAGKSTEAIRRVRDFEVQSIPYLVITSVRDIRYDPSGESIRTHSGKSVPATALTTLKTVLLMGQLAKAKHVLIEEAQFFPDLYEVVMEMVEKKGKHVLVFGLDGDSERRPFGQVLDLIPFADTYAKLQAECRLCGDGTAALFTKRYSSSTAQVCVGGGEIYKAVCRKHYLDPVRG